MSIPEQRPVGETRQPSATTPTPANAPAHPAGLTLLTVISTEEEFDWSAPFGRENTSVSAIQAVRHGQAVFDSCGVRPVYVVDYPVASNPQSAATLREILESGRCEIGAHLHPWVTPPFEEDVNPRNSFPGNLPHALERRKLIEVVHALERAFGIVPRAYQAGRYGVGPATSDLLEELGFEVDFSSSPGFDFSREGGPDFSQLRSVTHWSGRKRSVLSVPMSGAIVGAIPTGRVAVHRLASSELLRWTGFGSVVARLRLAERVRLSPEGFDDAALARLVQHLLDDGVRVFAFGLHSPSFMPGCTPYVTNAAELARFLDRIRRFYDFFLGDLGGRHVTPSELHLEMRATSRHSP
ncbi:MAG: polysaccharide deacetylase family protein [Planctomycetes bacterium]|nr:polysaccharide deacetylase family protein [Planctomycetota bacterium]